MTLILYAGVAEMLKQVKQFENTHAQQLATHDWNLLMEKFCMARQALVSCDFLCQSTGASFWSILGYGSEL